MLSNPVGKLIITNLFVEDVLGFSREVEAMRRVGVYIGESIRNWLMLFWRLASRTGSSYRTKIAEVLV